MLHTFILTATIGVSLILTVLGFIYDDFSYRQMGDLLFLLSLLIMFKSKIKFKNVNFLMFFSLVAAALLVGWAAQGWGLDMLNLGLWLGAYIFLIRQAIIVTDYKRGSSFTIFYFLVVTVAYLYLLSSHILEIESKVHNGLEFSIYIIYYINVFFFAVAALVYYLNSFSRKSVFFISLTIAFIFSDMLRDMEVFYFRDLSVEIVGTLLRFAALLFVFLFFTTPERKLRLIHLV